MKELDLTSLNWYKCHECDLNTIHKTDINLPTGQNGMLTDTETHRWLTTSYATTEKIAQVVIPWDDANFMIDWLGTYSSTSSSYKDISL